MSFERIVAGTRTFIDKNSPAILTGMSIAGAVSAVVLAVRATPEAHRELMDAESELGEPLTPVETVRLVWRHYVPTAVVLGLSVGTAIGAQGIHQRRQALLMGAYATLETSAREYRDKTREIIGEKKELEIRDDIARDHLTEAPMVNSQIFVTDKGDHLFMDSYSGRYFRSDIETVRKAVNDINEQCNNQMHASQNEFYEKIGLPPIGSGEELGWRVDNTMEVTFTSEIIDNQPVIILSYYNQPISGYYKAY